MTPGGIPAIVDEDLFDRVQQRFEQNRIAHGRPAKEDVSMMAKIVKGSDFKGAVDYIIDKKKDTQIVASEGLFMENLEDVYKRQGLQAISQVSLMENVGKTLLHRYFPYSKGAWP